MFKVNNKDIYLYCWLWAYFAPCSSVSIVSFEQGNADLVQSVFIIITSPNKKLLKACVRYFSFFHQMITLKIYEKCFLFQLKSFFCFEDIHIFVFPSSSLFPSVSYCSRRWSKLNLKVDGVINGLNKNLKTHLVWYFESERRSDIATWSIDRVLKEEYFMKNICGKGALKTISRPPF